MSFNDSYKPLSEMSLPEQSFLLTSKDDNDLLTQVNKFKDNYYSKNSKNMFFKKTQKAECAEQIAQQFDINVLLNNTVYIIGDTNQVFFDYAIFKLYANESNYQQIVDYVLLLFDIIIRKHGTYVTHVNLDTFTVSAAERYKKVIQTFNAACIRNTEFVYTQRLQSWHIYNPPSVIDMIHKILKPFIEPSVFNNARIISKEESAARLSELFRR